MFFRQPIKKAVLLSLLFTFSAFANLNERIIGGEPVPNGTYTEVIEIDSNNNKCTATVIGPRAILTAAHCVKPGDTASFSIKGQPYQARMMRSPLYPNQDHDVAIGITSHLIREVTPASVGGYVEIGTQIELLGYGCIQSGGGGGNDGILRKGVAVVTSQHKFDFITQSEKGSLCFGDSGGPAFVESDGKLWIVGVGSKGNIEDTSYFASTTNHYSKALYEKAVSENENLEICGYNLECQSPYLPPTKKFEFLKPIFEFDFNTNEQVWVDLNSLLKDKGVRFEPLWFTGPLAPSWIEINQQLDILHGSPKPEDAGSYLFALVVRDDANTGSTLVRLNISNE